MVFFMLFMLYMLIMNSSWNYFVKLLHSMLSLNKHFNHSYYYCLLVCFDTQNIDTKSFFLMLIFYFTENPEDWILFIKNHPLIQNQDVDKEVVWCWIITRIIIRIIIITWWLHQNCVCRDFDLHKKLATDLHKRKITDFIFFNISVNYFSHESSSISRQFVRMDFSQRFVFDT